jgi:creatinine amidohydrolase
MIGVMTGSALEASTATWSEVEAHIRSGCVALLPFGALEQHGPHLPLSTDTLMASGLAGRIAGSINSLLLPPVHYGETWNNARFPGTVSLSFETVRAITVDICAGLVADGLPGLVVVNGDYGNQYPLRMAARDAAQRWDFPVLVVDYPGLAEVAEEICETPPSGPGFYHADELETSIVLALAPETVHMERAVANYPQFPTLYGATPISLRDVSASGVFGDPRASTAAKGDALLSALGQRALALVTAFVGGLPGYRAPVAGS